MCCILLDSLGSNWGHSGHLGKCCQQDSATLARGSHHYRSVNTEVIERESKGRDEGLSCPNVGTTLSSHISELILYFNVLRFGEVHLWHFCLYSSTIDVHGISFLVRNNVLVNLDNPHTSLSAQQHQRVLWIIQMFWYIMIWAIPTQGQLFFEAFNHLTWSSSVDGVSIVMEMYSVDMQAQLLLWIHP